MLLRNKTNAINLSSKGVQLIKESKYQGLPIQITNEYIQESIYIYDQRMASVHGDIACKYSKTGLSPSNCTSFNERKGVIPQICFLDKDISRCELPITLSGEETIKLAPNYLFYLQSYTTLQEYLRVIKSDHIFDLRTISLIAIFLYLSCRYIIAENLCLVSFYQVGYILFNKSLFEAFVKAHFNEAKKAVEEEFLHEVNFDFQVVLDEMRKKSASSYPFHAPGYFNVERQDQLCIDLFTCTNMLNIYLEHRRVDGELANIRAATFEKTLQKLIDSTTYQPDEHVKALIKQNSIDCNSKQITDIDAAFVYKGTLILVSAKSYIYNTEYDQGNYATIRNIRTNIENDIQKWRKVIAFINKNPTGNNYDLSNYGEIQGILCTPSLFFIGADYYKSQIGCGINEYQSAIELYNLISKI